MAMNIRRLEYIESPVEAYFPQAAAVAPIWWTNNGAIPAPILAFRAVSTPGSAWGAGPTSLAESYVNLVNPGPYDLAPGTAPTWDATGLSFNGSNQYLVSAYAIPDNGQNHSAIVRFSDCAGTYRCLFSSGYNATNGACNCLLPKYNTTQRSLSVAHRQKITVAGAFTNGTYGHAAMNEYVDGAYIQSAGAPFASANSGYATFIGTFIIGANRYFYFAGKIQAFWMANYDATAYMADLHTIMMAL